MASLFRESVALTRCERWLTSLYSRSVDPNLEDRGRYIDDLAIVMDLLRVLLPPQVKIAEFNSEGVFFEVPGGAKVSVPDLSDGYRSFLALTIDILRHLQDSSEGLLHLLLPDSDNGISLQIGVEGVVLIDEADAHLHPIWQRELGRRLRQAFPKVQFIVTSHSPFIAQAASDGGLFVLRQQDRRGPVRLSQPEPSVKGWRLEQILLSPLFGLTEVRDEETEHLLAEHRELAAKKTWQSLTPEEQARLVEVEARLAGRLTAPGDTLEERKREEEMARYVDTTLKRLAGGG
jgi:predicted ATP-binding protein involved in virulence